MNDVIIISGPTAVGKSELALKLAKILNTEIISADSMQIYRYMDIGTAKVSQHELNEIKHNLINIKNPDENYSVQEFQNDALEIITNLHNQNKIPIVVGGTGLYIDSLTHNFDFVNVKPDYELREKLENLYNKDPETILNMVKEINFEHYKELGIKDKKKLIRAIEVFKKSNKLIDYSRKNNNKNINYHLFVLTDDREDLYNRINKRVDLMIKKGLLNEVENLLANKNVSKKSQSMKAIGYKEVISYLDKEISYEEMINQLKQNSRRYAKRQLTWFRRNELSKWIDISKYTKDEIIDIILKNLE